MASQIEKIINTYEHLSKIPSVVGGILSNNGTRITSKLSVRNLDKGKNTKYLYSYILNEQLDVVAESEFGLDISNELISAISPKETYRAVIREQKEGKELKKQFLEVWQKNKLAHCIDLTALDIHGNVYVDSEFGSLNWSHDEGSVVYVAERKFKKSEPYIKRKHEDDKSKADGSGENAPTKGEEFLYRQDWGEQLGGKYLSVIVVCHIKEENVFVLDGLPDSWCPGQVRFSPDGSSVVGVAWETEPRRLGLIFCTNRPSCIFNLTLDGHMTLYSDEGRSVRSPRFSPEGHLFWLQRSKDGPHHACHELVTRNNNTNSISTVINVVENVYEKNGMSFYGLYNQSLPINCFASNGRLVFSTPQRNSVHAYVAGADGSYITDISINAVPGSTSILDVKSDVILASFSNMTTPTQLYVARLPEKGKEADIKWLPVGQQEELLKSCTVEYMDLEHPNSMDSVKSFSAIYFAPAPKDKQNLPLVVCVHGGPHAGYVNAYSLDAALFNMLGYATLFVNYRGSTGSGQASVDFLLNYIGDTDVKDCKLATDKTIEKFAVDPKNICLFGGSHGGFLVTHLSGQYPDMYSAVVCRNPVIDIASMINSTDIADWCAVEAGYQFTEQGPVSEDQLVAMRRCSPLVHVHKVKAPTAIMLGAVDKRVPYYQGLEYARRLKANGVTTRVYMYDDNHSLSSLPAEMDNLINSAHWFLQHFRT